MKKCQVTKLNQKSIKNKRRSSAGLFNTSSAGAVTSLIDLGNQKMPFRTRVASARRHGRSALILGRNLRNVLNSIFLIALLVSIPIANQAHATTSTLTISITDSVVLDITPVSNDGTFATSDTSANNVSVKTDNGTGYTLGIKASVDNNNTLSTTGGASIPSHTITAGVSESNYQDDTYAEANNLNNTWGYRPSKLNSVSNSNYLPGPTSASTVIELDKTNVANASTFNNYNLAIGARVDTATAPGEYSNVFVFTVVANPAVYSITYNKNTTDTVTNMPANVVNQQTSNETVTLDSARPQRNDYVFLGWCTSQVIDNGTCSGTTYGAGGTWTLDQTLTTNSLNVYAIWGEPTLYNYVAAMSKGTQTVKQLRTVIDDPDETNTVSTNSGVYEYNASVFGTASDDSSACTRAGGCPIYYYRGILDSYGHTGTYGSDGDNDAFPNTVVLSSASSKSGLTTDDTCWRIVRTTGSGGVKMIYQGKWTGSTCANAQTNAQVATSAFNGTRYTYQQIVRVGYTYNSTFAVNTSKSDSIANIFGSNSNPEKNNTRSTIKEYIEDTWYSDAIGTSSGHDYTSKLEASAGYCNDRTMNTSTTWTSPLAESSTITSTYGRSDQQAYYFGAWPRNTSTTQAPSLTCGNKYSQIDRSAVDLYRYVLNSVGTSNELKYPAALLTTDESSLAGSGFMSVSTPFNSHSYLRSGSRFWLMSPYARASDGSIAEFSLKTDGSLFDKLGRDQVSVSYGVRPAISLTPGTVVASGSGTATDPWIVNP